MPIAPEHISNTRPEPLSPKLLSSNHTIRRTRWLLAQAWLRLRAGRRLEASRGIIYPEVGITARDVERLIDKLSELTQNAAQITPKKPKNPLARQKS